MGQTRHDFKVTDEHTGTHTFPYLHIHIVSWTNKQHIKDTTSVRLVTINRPVKYG